MSKINRETLAHYFLPCFISLLTGLFIALFIPLYYNRNSGNIEVIHEIRNSENYQFINPLLECDSAEISSDRISSSLKNQVQNYINQQVKYNNISFASIYYRDLNNGPWVGINHGELFSPASLIKVPLMMAYYHSAEKDPSILQKKILNTQPFDPKSQNIQPEEHLQMDQEYTVDELINRMIIYSDNLAYNLLLQNIDSQKIYQVYNDLGVDISLAASNPNGNILNVSKYASFFRILFNSSYLNKDESERALKLLSQVKYKQGLVAGVPQNITVSHKFGERQYLATGEKQLHDCGIVYLPKKPYLICVMTRGNDFNKEANVIKGISNVVYNEVYKTIN